MLTEPEYKNAVCPPDKKQARFADSGGILRQGLPSNSYWPSAVAITWCDLPWYSRVNSVPGVGWKSRSRFLSLPVAISEAIFLLLRSSSPGSTLRIRPPEVCRQAGAPETGGCGWVFHRQTVFATGL